MLGPITMREALMKSKNLASVRILDAIGPDYAKQFAVERFGFGADKLVANLPMVLGAGSVTPLQMARAFAVFANGGYRVEPYLISRIADGAGATVFTASPFVAGKTAPRTLSAANSYIMTSLLQSVAQHGTGAATNVLGRPDLAGKTGTTNDFRDGWFAGYQRQLVTVTWIGFDTPRTLGNGEWGGRSALPMWTEYMRGALDGVPIYRADPPDDVEVVDAELFERERPPGGGFVPEVGGAPSGDGGMGMPLGADNAGRAAAPVSAVDEDEKKRILRYFGSP